MPMLLLIGWRAEPGIKDEPQHIKMAKLFKQVVMKEMADNSFKPRDRSLSGRTFGREAIREDMRGTKEDGR